MSIFRKTTDESQLLLGLRSDGSQRRGFENSLYLSYNYLIQEGIWKHRLSQEDSSTAYSDTILTVIEHVHSGRFEGRSGLKTYVHQIFSNKCVDFIRKKTTNKAAVYRADTLTEALNYLPDEARTVIQQLIQEQDARQLRERLAELTEKCRSMLLSWAEGFPDEDIAKQMGYQSAAVAKTSRLRCLDKLRESYQNGKTAR
jgi:RNA polymerase sigma factor (sigma-70 family)